MISIHPSAIVSKDADIKDGATVSAYSIIEGNASIGENTFIGPHVHVYGDTSIGENCKIYTSAIIGSPPQDLKYKNEKSYVRIGNYNTIREFVTINKATGENESTVIGNNNLFMAYSHIAHNCIIGNNVIIANCGTLAGHVTIEDYAILGGLAGIHQFCRIGRMSIIGGTSKVIKDIVPYVIADGHPARPYGINKLGLKRKNYPPEVIDNIEEAYRIIFRENLSLSDAIEKILLKPGSPEIREMVEFIKNSRRGISKER
ncbi:MAG: acyl-ACP--UDP-N-acetylglucosamine O-acyltransferase [Candidatus Omnitrophica bacterium]|nr:acyl-ACP--UDP-N-acetylglucosamine O-acyltransferase [Candidatus Omnitrophota bacterium]